MPVSQTAPGSQDYTSGNFTLKGSEIGQPVDMTSARSYAITGPNQRWSNWEDQGNQTCMVETTFDPCDENWTLSFRSTAGDSVEKNQPIGMIEAMKVFSEVLADHAGKVVALPAENGKLVHPGDTLILLES